MSTSSDKAAKKYIVGVDVGGTFTDVFFLDEATGECDVAKVPSTRPDQSVGFIEGIRKKVDDFSELATVVHGTTVGTNALLERKGAVTGIITTKGFRDALEMRRRDRPQTWGLWGQFEPVVPRDRRLEVGERTLADGTIHEAVDADEVKAAANQLLELGAESVCIVFINSYANADNENAALAAVREVWPNDHIVTSSEILPEIREFERTSTATLNAYLQPPIGNYLHRLETALGDDGFEVQVLIVQSNGGVMSVDTARRLPIRTALSGPAAGVIASAHIAVAAGFPNVITCDMGGTSFDVSLVAEGQSALSAQTNIDFGMVVRTPMIEITTIGAGGGSIAWVDRGGLLQIGPESAGSNPGPVCYGQGNDRPTVTDANVVLGRINADRPIGGKLDRLDVEAAKKAIMVHVGEPLDLDVMQAAEAVIRVANSKMAGAIRLVSIERGHNPNEFAGMPFGGGGALHAGALMKDVGLKNALVPRFPGVTSALGCTIADMRHDFVQTLNGVLGDLNVTQLDSQMTGLAGKGLNLLEEAGVSFGGIDTVFELDMSYMGQTHTVDVALPIIYEGGATGVSEEDIREAFEARYRQVYGRPLDGIAIRVLNLRVSVIGRRPKFDLSLLAPKGDASLESSHLGTRQVWVDGAWHEANIYERLPLPVGTIIPGPALLEQPDTTIFIEPDLTGLVDDFGNIVISRKPEA
ncbi:MAG: hydantoinase/oxoprolinase family protein [Alphaproteobacteria bacterium]|nr:hydantoinase/oxoprolinase family protein [Alphaproteobacteria bacterium]